MSYIINENEVGIKAKQKLSKYTSKYPTAKVEANTLQAAQIPQWLLFT